MAACCVAKPGGYLAPGGYSTSVVSYSSSIVHPSPAVYSAPAPAPVVYSVPAPAPVVYSAPAPAPAVVPPPAPAPVVYSAPAPVVAAPAVVAAPVAAAVKTQYHSQDEHGQAAYGHSEPGQIHNAVQVNYI